MPSVQKAVPSSGAKAMQDMTKLTQGVTRFPQNNPKPKPKIYTERMVTLGTFFGGPLVAGYFIAENFKAFNEAEKAKKTWMIVIAGSIVLFSMLFYFEDKIDIPNGIIPFVMVMIAVVVVQIYQRKNIADHLDSGGEKFSWWRVVGFSIIGFIITVVVILVFAFLSMSEGWM